MNWFMIGDLFLLLGVPVIFAVLLLVATLTPGNPLVGILIGWAADATWLGLGGLTAYKRYWPKR